MRKSVFPDKIKVYNKVRPLADYLVPFIGDKKKVKIADIACGPFSLTGQTLDGVEVEVYLSDKRDYKEEYTRHNATPTFPIEVQDMEKLTYSDNFFDIVHCVNSLDHTKDAPTAVKEMIRICKPGGYVYIQCWLDQMSTTGGWHYWDAEEDGTMIGRRDYKFDLKDFGFDIKYVDNGGKRRYNYIIATLQK